jgi:hypothetical protein
MISNTHSFNLKYFEIAMKKTRIIFTVSREGSRAENFLTQKNNLPLLSCIRESEVSNAVDATLQHHELLPLFDGNRNLGGITSKHTRPF